MPIRAFFYPTLKYNLVLFYKIFFENFVKAKRCHSGAQSEPGPRARE